VIRVALKTLLKNKVGNLYLQNFTSASARWLCWFHIKLSPHILQQNCAHATHILGSIQERYSVREMSAQGRNEGVKGGTITRAPNHCGYTEKSQKCHKYSLQYSKFASERAQVRTWGRQTCFLPLAPSNIVMPSRLPQASNW